MLQSRTGPKLSQKNTAVFLTMLALQTFEHFLSEPKDVAFCMYVKFSKCVKALPFLFLQK